MFWFGGVSGEEPPEGARLPSVVRAVGRGRFQCGQQTGRGRRRQGDRRRNGEAHLCLHQVSLEKLDTLTTLDSYIFPINLIGRSIFLGWSERMCNFESKIPYNFRLFYLEHNFNFVAMAVIMPTLQVYIR